MKNNDKFLIFYPKFTDYFREQSNSHRQKEYLTDGY